MLQHCFCRIRQLESETGKEQLLDQLRDKLIDELTPVPGTTVFDRRILPAMQFINTHLDGKLLISQLARLCFMSPFHFQRIFKASVGLTLKAYIQQQRTELGKQQLMEGRPASEAVYDTGYFDQGHFHKAFKKMWVVNPTHFS